MLIPSSALPQVTSNGFSKEPVTLVTYFWACNTLPRYRNTLPRYRAGGAPASCLSEYDNSSLAKLAQISLREHETLSNKSWKRSK